MTWPGTRWEPPHGHDGEWSADCDPCRSEWIERRAAEIVAEAIVDKGLRVVQARPSTYTEAEELAAAELAEEYEGEDPT